jgi:DivIVA domain-containing protein
MTISQSDIQSAQFATARVGKGYRMSDVDAFLDWLDQGVGELLAELAERKAAEEMWQAQAGQLRVRLERVTAELEAARAQHSTVVVPVSASEIADTREQAVIGAVHEARTPDEISRIKEVRNRVQAMLQEQLRLLDEYKLPD